MDHALAQIGILAAGLAGGHVLIRLGSAGTNRVRSAFHRTSAAGNYNQQANYQPSGYYQSQYPYSYYR